ncbi:phosphate uptake regulator, PhoU [Thalassoporum mexicanum PCC 7367]|uniref:phosphate signaling complex protein PhoU n=1 Tax=Thalassoporum mexicanum TaxID=3457544 RepID=UPI00029FF81F|nr:phosphate signaling complex protein PhoU [Pseudanabaena sp. PCC 7367]AFY70830.1 phosphate uptake regulator, PhoU [Pseudanabaena sp. PCC 7367]
MQELSDHGQIRSKFDRQLIQIQQNVLRMGALVESSFWLAHTALFERNLESALQLALQDKQIDRYYRQIEQDCINAIALQAPVSRDLRWLSAMMQLTRDLERIGDYAENLGEIAVKLFPYPIPTYIARIEMMANRCRAMLALSLVALANMDAEAGFKIKIKDDAVDDDYQDLYNLLSCQKPDSSSSEPIMLSVLAIHHLERMADHATNIGQRVGYVVTGDRS